MSKFIKELIKGESLETRIRVSFYTHYIKCNFPVKELTKREVKQAENFANEYTEIVLKQIKEFNNE